jgi:hypothetical protein
MASKNVKQKETKIKTAPAAGAPAIAGEPKQDARVQAIIKDLEQCFFTIKFYPVATKEDSLNEAKEKVKTAYAKENETVRQLVLYMIHENIAQAIELKTMHNFDHFKGRSPNNDAAQLRMSVYKSMFNFNSSLEGIMEFISLLGELEGDDAAKLLSYHFGFFSTIEVEGMHMLRNAVIEALGNSNSEYALKCLLRYGKYCDNDRMLQRIAAELAKWDEKLDKLKLPQKEKLKLKEDLDEMLAIEAPSSHKAHYG